MNTFSPSPPTFGPRPVSAYIPCYNNAGTVGPAIQAIQNQTHPVQELFVVDDGSADNSAEVAESLGARVIRMGKNRGRGAARALAMETARNELVLCCDATNRLPANFLETSLKWFSSERVAGVFGRMVDPNPRTTIDRWRARHLFKQDDSYKVVFRGDFSSGGAIVRKSAVMQAGNYNSLLRQGEDYDLGERLLALGDVVADPALIIEPLAPNTLFQMMERFARWNRASIESYALGNFIESHVLAWRILIPLDLKERDFSAALISATVPYFAVAYANKKPSTQSVSSALKKERTGMIF